MTQGFYFGTCTLCGEDLAFSAAELEKIPPCPGGCSHDMLSGKDVRYAVYVIDGEASGPWELTWE